MLNPDDAAIPERRFGVTPLDLRNAKLKTAMRGFDRDDVQELLRAVADDYESALRENERLRQELARMDGALNQHRELEGSLRNTLVSAQKVADDIRDTAAQDAARIVREAEAQAEAIVQQALARAGDLGQTLDTLLEQRRSAEAGVEATIAALSATLEQVRMPKPVAPAAPKADAVITPAHVEPAEPAAPAASAPEAAAPAPATAPVAAPVVAAPTVAPTEAPAEAAPAAAPKASASASTSIDPAEFLSLDMAAVPEFEVVLDGPHEATPFEKQISADLELVVGHRPRVAISAIAV